MKGWVPPHVSVRLSEWSIQQTSKMAKTQQAYFFDSCPSFPPPKQRQELSFFVLCSFSSLRSRCAHVPWRKSTTTTKLVNSAWTSGNWGQRYSQEWKFSLFHKRRALSTSFVITYGVPIICQNSLVSCMNKTGFPFFKIRILSNCLNLWTETQLRRVRQLETNW